MRRSRSEYRSGRDASDDGNLAEERIGVSGLLRSRAVLLLSAGMFGAPGYSARAFSCSRSSVA